MTVRDWLLKPGSEDLFLMSAIAFKRVSVVVLCAPVFFLLNFV